MNLSPEEKYRQEIWWILREIKKAHLYSLEMGEKTVEFAIRIPSGKKDSIVPPANIQRKLLNLLKKQNIIEFRQDLREVLSRAIKEANKKIDRDYSLDYKLPPLPKPPTKYILKVNKSKFDKIYNFYEKGQISKASKPKMDGQEVKFDGKKAMILIGNCKCQLPPYKNEYYLCKIMFGKKVGLPVDWSEIYEEVTGDYESRYGKPPKIKENWRVVYDTMRRANERVKKKLNTNEELFSWQELTVKRNF